MEKSTTKCNDWLINRRTLSIWKHASIYEIWDKNLTLFLLNHRRFINQLINVNLTIFIKDLLQNKFERQSYHLYTPRTIQFPIISLRASSVFSLVFVVFANFLNFQPSIVLILPFYKITSLIPEININILWSAATWGEFEPFCLLGQKFFNSSRVFMAFPSCWD